MKYFWYLLYIMLLWVSEFIWIYFGYLKYYELWILKNAFSRNFPFLTLLYYFSYKLIVINCHAKSKKQGSEECYSKLCIKEFGTGKLVKITFILQGQLFINFFISVSFVYVTSWAR